MSESPIDALPVRLLNVFISPGRVMNQLAERPAWLGVLMLTTLISAITAALIPPELIYETLRQQLIEQGVSVEDFGEAQLNVLRYGRIPGAVVGTLLLQFGIAALYSVIFTFVLGDDGRYSQYLAAVSHGWFIPVLIGVLLLPLVIQTENLELRLTVDVFIAGFFEPGFVRNVAKLLDLTVIWSILVIAQGAHAIDRRRSFASAAAVMLTIFFVYAIGVGLLQTR
ncbi:MAG: YIP1 family protein [Longimicrobiales bacterium]